MRAKKQLTRFGGMALATLLAIAFGQDKPPVPLAANDIHATPITLHVKRAAVKDVLAEITKQSGIKIQLDGMTNDPITLDEDQQPFWNVLTDVCSKTNLGVNNGYWGDNALHVMQGFSQPGQRVIAGPVMANLMQIQRAELMTAPADQREICNVDASVQWEPRLAIAYFETYSRPTTAVDENGVSLVSGDEMLDPRNPDEAPFGTPNQYGNAASFFQHSIRLKIPANAGRKIAHLSGQIRLWVIDKTATGEIADLKATAKKPPTLTIEGQSFKINNIWLQDAHMQVQFTVSKNPGETEENWTRRMALLRSVRGHVDGEDDKPWDKPNDARNNGYGSNGDSANFYLNFQRADGINSAPKKLTLEVPASTAELDVPYDLHDLPMP